MQGDDGGTTLVAGCGRTRQRYSEGRSAACTVVCVRVRRARQTRWKFFAKRKRRLRRDSLFFGRRRKRGQPRRRVLWTREARALLPAVRGMTRCCPAACFCVSPVIRRPTVGATRKNDACAFAAVVAATRRRRWCETRDEWSARVEGGDRLRVCGFLVDVVTRRGGGRVGCVLRRRRRRDTLILSLPPLLR